jgi:hypothetical protein
MAAKSSGGKPAKSPKLTAAKRKAMPPGSFGLPSKKKYPIDTAGRARDALGRVAQHGGPAEKAVVRARVAKKYPGINVTGVAGQKKK